MKYKYIDLEIRNCVGWFLFNRPPVNAVDWDMLDELGRAFRELAEMRRVRVIVIASRLEEYFSAGADLSSFANSSPRSMQEWVENTHELATQIRGANQPILAAIQGVAVGGGLEMSLHADLRFATHGARLGQPEINIAFLPPVAGTQALVRLVGRSAAFRILYEGELIDAQKALSIGLVDFLSEPGQLEADVQGYAERLVEKPANALAAIRRCLVDGGGATFDDGMKIERQQANRLSGHPNFQIGVTSFLGKSKPRWT
ncbi:MAG: enoyl-CoA hydratase/isomerase family protein [Hyphomicrobiaceae bacterium]